MQVVDSIQQKAMIWFQVWLSTASLIFFCSCLPAASEEKTDRQQKKLESEYRGDTTKKILIVVVGAFLLLVWFVIKRGGLKLIICPVLQNGGG